MDRNRIEGAAQQLKGSMKEAVGRATNSPGMVAEGSGDRAAGKVQGSFGRFLDVVRRSFGRRML